MDIAYIVKKLESKQNISDSEIYEIQEYLSDIIIALDRNDKIYYNKQILFAIIILSSAFLLIKKKALRNDKD